MDDFNDNYTKITGLRHIEMSETSRLLMERTIKQLGIKKESSKLLIRAMCEALVTEGASIAMRQVADILKLVNSIDLEKK